MLGGQRGSFSRRSGESQQILVQRVELADAAAFGEDNKTPEARLDHLLRIHMLHRHRHRDRERVRFVAKGVLPRGCADDRGTPPITRGMGGSNRPGSSRGCVAL